MLFIYVKYEGCLKSIKDFGTSCILGKCLAKKAAKKSTCQVNITSQLLSTPAIGKGIRKMNETDKEVSTYYFLSFVLLPSALNKSRAVIAEDQRWSPKWYIYISGWLWVDFNFHFLL